MVVARPDPEVQHPQPSADPLDPLHAPLWHVCVDEGPTVGPVSAHQIARGVRAGRVPSHATIRRESDVFWSDLLDVPDLVLALKDVSAETETPPASAPPSLLAKQFLVWVDDSEPVGPVSADQIARGIRAGKVPSHASVQRVDDFFASDVLDAPEVIDALKRL
jgi:hypothetical protein